MTEKNFYDLLDELDVIGGQVMRTVVDLGDALEAITGDLNSIREDLEYYIGELDGNTKSAD